MLYRVLYYGCISPPSRKLKAAIERRLSAATIRPVSTSARSIRPFYLQPKPKILQLQVLRSTDELYVERWRVLVSCQERRVNENVAMFVVHRSSFWIFIT